MKFIHLHNTEPRFHYGYVVVIATFFILMVSLGLYNVFGVFFNPLLAEFGWTRAMTSGAFSMSMILHGVLGMFMGGLADRFGPRSVVMLCGIILGLGYLLMSQVSTLWQLYLFYGLMIGIGMSGFWVPILSSIARWFDERRSLMTGIVVSGAGIGGLIAPPLLSRLIAAYDWRISYIVQGSVIILIVVLGVQFLRRAPGQQRQLPHGEYPAKLPGGKPEAEAVSLKEAANTLQFWLVFIMFFCFGFCLFSFMVHIVPHATDLGVSAIDAANILAVIHGTSIPGNFIMGGLGDRIGNRKVFFIGFIFLSVIMLWLVVATEMWMLYIIAAIFGFNLGGMATSESPVVAGIFGLRSHGLLLGVLDIGFTVGASLGPLVTGYIFDLAGSYDQAFLVCAVLGVVGIIMAATLRPVNKMGIKI
ncbi:MFS transporter [Chloroflexota bacterium]